MYTRCDDTETVHYFSSVDFVGLNKEEYNFKSSLGHDLKGYIYYYDNYIKDACEKYKEQQNRRNPNIRSHLLSLTYNNAYSLHLQ
jgi:hypothetical protein